MLLAKQVLNPVTKKQFGIFRDPFADDAMQSSEDVFTTPDIRYVREALYHDGAFLAVLWRLSGNPARGKARCAAT